MSNDVDVADSEVEGLARYLPTKWSKGIVIAIFGAPLPVFQLVRGNVEWFFLQERTPLEQTLVAALAALTISMLMSLLLALELAHVIRSRKHRRIVHYSNEHPHMSFRWLFVNARGIHFSVALCLLIAAFLWGYVLGA